jgi:hypothetical protein
MSHRPRIQLLSQKDQLLFKLGRGKIIDELLQATINGFHI